MAKFILQAVKREGFEHVWRGGRAWPATPTEVEVLEEQEECPTITVTESGRPDRVALHPRQIGQKNWRSIMADGRISKTPAGLEAAAAKASATLSRMGTELAQREAEIERLGDQLAEAAEDLAKREARIDELEAEVAALKAAAEIAAKGKPAEGPAKPAEEPPADKGGKKK